jgi:hypothetical protein
VVDHQAAGLGGMVHFYYYGRFSRSFHAKVDLFNKIIVFLVQAGGGFIQEKDHAVLFQPGRPLIWNREGPGPRQG